MATVVEVVGEIERLVREGSCVNVAGQQIACSSLFDTPRCEAALFRLRPGQLIPAHTHAAIDDVFFGLRGRGRIRTWDARGVPHEHPVEAGTMVLVEPETPHEVACAGDEFCYILLQTPKDRGDHHAYRPAGAGS